MHGTEEEPERGDSGIDFQAALAMAGGDIHLLRELAKAFLDEVPKLLHLLRSAVDQRDSEMIKKAAHKLQGVMRCLHIDQALLEARRLELIGEGTIAWSAAESVLASLNSVIDRAIEALEDYLGRHV